MSNLERNLGRGQPISLVPGVALLERWTLHNRYVHTISMFFPGSNSDLPSQLCVELPEVGEEMNIQRHPDLILLTGLQTVCLGGTLVLWGQSLMLIITPLGYGSQGIDFY